MRRVLILSPATDYAGVGINLKHAFDAYPGEWQARHVRRRAGPYAYPADMEWPRRNREITLKVRELYAKSDVIHVMDNPNVLRHFHRQQQRYVVQHLGTRYRQEPEAVSAVCRLYDAVEITDSLDLVNDHVRFVPAAVNTELLARERRRLYKPDASVVRIAHAPTSRQWSDTDVVESTIERLEREFRVEFDLIENVTNAQCITRKARADIYVDRFGVGFGVNAIECWAMGIPVLSGFSDPAVTERGRREFGELPWIDTSRATLYENLRALILDHGRWIEYSQRGIDHAERFHSYRAVVERTTAAYADALMAVAA